MEKEVRENGRLNTKQNAWTGPLQRAGQQLLAATNVAGGRIQMARTPRGAARWNQSTHPRRERKQKMGKRQK